MQGRGNGYLEYGNPRVSPSKTKVSTVSGGLDEEGQRVTRVREAEANKRPSVTASSVPVLPSLDTSRLNADGLKRLQQHLEKLGGAEDGEGAAP